MLIAQITDIHIGFDRGNPDEANRRRLRALLDRLANGPNRPDLLLMTGDLTESGDGESFAWLAEAVRDCPYPVWPMVGNHDNRAALLAAFPDTPQDGGFVQYAVARDGLRLLLLDTTEPGRHGGAFCAERAAWLSAQLQAHQDIPTVIAMHHPPFVTGIDWMDPDPAEPWIARFAEATGGHDQIQAVVCGHLHRPIVTRWNGAALVVGPSSAPAIALDLRAIDPGHPDSRALVRDEPPGYALHRWDGRALVTHFESVGNFTALAKFDEKMQPVVRGMLAERP